MSETISVDLDHQERDILLRGLRHVRSSIALAVCDPTPESNRQRDEDLQDVEDLIARLSGSQKKSVAKV
ncbi:MAG: hypothetical protein HUJ26_03880 [Planctomycetaceae bacterium]|jgi:hypothetical protein|nr:hypothetical protein [Planctomycetaceae bacterium]